MGETMEKQEKVEEEEKYSFIRRDMIFLTKGVNVQAKDGEPGKFGYTWPTGGAAGKDRTQWWDD